jgi:hypothetical protein
MLMVRVGAVAALAGWIGAMVPAVEKLEEGTDFIICICGRIAQGWKQADPGQRSASPDGQEDARRPQYARHGHLQDPANFEAHAVQMN